MSLCRMVFLLFNINYFSQPSIWDFLHGIRFDFSAIAWYLLPYYFIVVLPFEGLRKILNKWYVDLYYILIVAIFITGNSIDVIYYKFILKRSTFDVFNFISTGDDTVDLLPVFMRDYWYMLVIGFGLFGLFLYLNNKIRYQYVNTRFSNRSFYSLLILFTLIIGARGGFQLKPLNIIDASRYSTGQNVPLLINTPFSIMKTLKADQLESRTYFDEVELLELYDPHIKIEKDSNARTRNVVLIIMESLSKEYIGYYNNGAGYTPFLDSLMEYSLVAEQAYANGKKSIEALPAILSGIPNLMTAPYNSSAYAGNQVYSIAKSLKEYGYTSHFFHGGKNGTMGFDSYVQFIGFDHYYGKNEYPNQEDFDGNWGIYDIPYFQYFADMQAKMKEPFLSTIFSLSAHHPYSLPETHKELCSRGKLPIHPTICYSDDALRKYINKVRKEDWYKRSIFLITADHTAQNVDPMYGTSKGIYAIPIILFDPQNPVHSSISKVTQQSDIPLSLPAYLGLETEITTFGQNMFDSSSTGFAINYLNDVYQYIDHDHTYLFDGNQIIGIYNNSNDPLMKKNLKSQEKDHLREINRLKAIIQTYNDRLINNTLVQ